MTRLEIVPFADEHLDAAGALLAARHARDRQAELLLPEQYEDPVAAQAEVAGTWQEDDASGAAGFRDGRLVGYLIGAPNVEPHWGENVWVEAPGQAVEEAEDARDLYALAAARWVEEGRRQHYAVVPANDAALVDAWFRLGFGHQQAMAVRDVPEWTEVRVPDGFEIRDARADDIEEMPELDLALPTHQAAAPVFSLRPPPTRDQMREEWRDTLSEDQEQVLIGWLGDRPVACWSICAAELAGRHRGLLRPVRASYLGFAVT